MPKAKEQSVAYSVKKKSPAQKVLKNPKQTTLKMLRNLKDNATYEDIMYELYVLTNIQRGLKDLDAGRIVSHEEVKKSLRKWIA